MSEFKLQVLTPEGEKFNAAVESLVAPGWDGQFGVLPRHAAMVAALKRGVLTVKTNGQNNWFVVGEGVLEVATDSVVILCDDLTKSLGQEDAKAKIRQTEASSTHAGSAHAGSTHAGTTRAGAARDR